LAASGGRDDHAVPLPVYYRTENAAGNLPALLHCQNGGDVCLAGNADGVCCPEDSCDIDDGVRVPPNYDLCNPLTKSATE
jgi:hypothetical protein